MLMLQSFFTGLGLRVELLAGSFRLSPSHPAVGKCDLLVLPW
jgi:hypothetical protein